MRKLIVFLFIIFVTGNLYSQNIRNVQQKIKNGRIVITYDLEGNDEQAYDVCITAENNEGNKITPKVTSGDIVYVTPGENRIIYWEPQLEGRRLKGWSIKCKLEHTGFVTVTAKEIHTNEEVDGLEIFVDNSNSNEVTQSTLELPTGERFITLRSPDYKAITKKVTIEEDQNLDEKFDVVLYSWYRNKAKTWGTHGWIGTISTLLLAGTGFWMNSQANNSFDNYNNATTTEDALDFRDKTDQYANYRDISYTTASATCLYAMISWIVSSTYKSKSHPEARQ